MSYWYGLFIINLWSNGNSGVLYNAKQIQILSLIKILKLCLHTFYGVFVFCLKAILMVRKFQSGKNLEVSDNLFVLLIICVLSLRYKNIKQLHSIKTINFSCNKLGN